MGNEQNAIGEYSTLSVGRINFPVRSLAVGNTPPAPVGLPPYAAYAYTLLDDSYLQAPLPADYNIGTETDLSVYLRWGCNENFAANNAEVSWQVEWNLCGQNTEALPGRRRGLVCEGDNPIPVTARMVQETRIADIADDYIQTGDTIGLTITRVAIEDGTEPTAEPEIYAVWIIYERMHVWGQVALNS